MTNCHELSMVVLLILLLVVDKAASYVSIHRDGACPLVDALHLNINAAVFLFNKARNEIGFPSVVPAMEKSGRTFTDIDFVEKSFFKRSDGMTTVIIDGVPVTYLRIYKSGNDDVRLGMWSSAQNRNRTKGARFGDMTAAALGSAINMDHSIPAFKSLWKPLISNAFPNSSMNLFTLVREPFSHFNAGLREYIYRLETKDKAIYTSATKKMISHSDMHLILTDIINATLRYPHPGSGGAFFHFVPQTSRFYPTGDDLHIGQLERLNEDLTEIAHLFKLKQLFDASKHRGFHPTSKDPQGVGEALTALLANDLRYKRALCWLLLPDFTCLPFYTLPAECADIEVTAAQMKSFA
jgi:hypothetical protein